MLLLRLDFIKILIKSICFLVFCRFKRPILALSFIRKFLNACILNYGIKFFRVIGVYCTGISRVSILEEMAEQLFLRLLTFSLIFIFFHIYFKFLDSLGFDFHKSSPLGGSMRVLLSNSGLSFLVFWSMSLCEWIYNIKSTKNRIHCRLVPLSWRFLYKSCISRVPTAKLLCFSNFLRPIFVIATAESSFEIAKFGLVACILALGSHDRSDRSMLVRLWYDTKNLFVIKVLSHGIFHGL